MDMDLAAHHLGDFHICGYGIFRAVLNDSEVLRTHAEYYIARDIAASVKRIGNIRRYHYLGVSDKCRISAAGAFQCRIEEIHLRHPDESCYKKVCGMIEKLLWRPDLHHISVLHYDYPVTEGHRLCLVVCDVYEGSPYLLTE